MSGRENDQQQLIGVRRVQQRVALPTKDCLLLPWGFLWMSGDEGVCYLRGHLGEVEDSDAEEEDGPLTLVDTYSVLS